MFFGALGWIIVELRAVSNFQLPKSFDRIFFLRSHYFQQQLTDVVGPSALPSAGGRTGGTKGKYPPQWAGGTWDSEWPERAATKPDGPNLTPAHSTRDPPKQHDQSFGVAIVL